MNRRDFLKLMGWTSVVPSVVLATQSVGRISDQGLSDDLRALKEAMRQRLDVELVERNPADQIVMGNGNVLRFQKRGRDYFAYVTGPNDKALLREEERAET